MRDPTRIDKFCDALKELWKSVPDWRFGQLMCNFLGSVYVETKLDVFFIEDDEMLKQVIDKTKNGRW